MNSISVLEILSQPLLLIKIEEIKVCLGHQEFGQENQKHDKIKETGFKWLNEKRNDPTIKDCNFDIDDKYKKLKRPFYTYTHVNDLKSCDHYQIHVNRSILDLIIKDFLEKEPFAES